MMPFKLLHYLYLTVNFSPWQLYVISDTVPQLGLPDLPYFMESPVFEADSPTSHLKPLRETLSPIL